MVYVFPISLAYTALLHEPCPRVIAGGTVLFLLLAGLIGTAMLPHLLQGTVSSLRSYP